ncbi:hypothetical protein DN745_01230 [Bradymonas sediminis]|uniref:Uncharacterized protein n=2 Tax=Bradymonas sediminis TaxID=1548548 RepID=A0A2Z4FH23_9DELT|nr:hypothetical protein DN745_01230 [Bradymonas sediminis]
MGPRGLKKAETMNKDRPTVEFEGFRYQVRDGESLLDSLIRGGAEVDFSCRHGVCQTCMMRVLSGEVNLEATKALRQELVDSGHFLPCRAHPKADLTVGLADYSQLTLEAIVSEKVALSPSVVRLSIEPAVNLDWTPGQYINLINPEGISRNYSIASIAEEDYFVHLHVKRVDNGVVSGWIHDALEVGDFIKIQGPMGECVYDLDNPERTLVLLATGTGLAPLYGVLRDALRHGHRGPILLYHGVATPDELYLNAELVALARAHANLRYFPCVGEQSVTQAAFDSPSFSQDVAEHALYLCGNPGMVYHARYLAIGAGFRRAHILADPFISDEPYWPQDGQKLQSLPPEPELWAALEQGPKLRRILEDVYDQIYADPRLSPFFQHATKERAISKQYEFLAAIFHAESSYFGLNPFNAHHWMIFSDEIFDHREDLFENTLRKHGVQERFIRRWMSIQELFRREMVKSSERGMIMGGEEHLKSGYSQEVLGVGSICDGCQRELPAGSAGLMHQRTGHFYCVHCNPHAVG